MSLSAASYAAGGGQPHPLLAPWFSLEADRSLPRVVQGLLVAALAGLATLAWWPARAPRRGRLGALAALCAALALEQWLALHIPFQVRVAPAVGAYVRLAGLAPTAVLVALGLWLGAPALPPALRRWAWASAGLYLVGAVACYGLSRIVNPTLAPSALTAALLVTGQALELAAVCFVLDRALAQAAGATFTLRFSASRPARVLRALLLAAGVLAGLGAMATVSAMQWGGALADDLARRLSHDAENSLAAVFSGLLLISAAALCGLLAGLRRAERDRWWPQWALLAAALAYVAVDELAALHEYAGLYLPASLTFVGTEVFRWVLLAAPLVAGFALLYLRFLLRLPAHTRLLLLAAGALYVGGALGFEVAGAVVFERWSQHSLAYLLTTTVEEVLEMAALALLLYTLLAYLAAGWGHATVQLLPTRVVAAAPAAPTPVELERAA